MNWQFKLLMIATLTIAISCKKKEKEKIELQPNNQVGAIFVEFNPDSVYTVQLDSTISGNFRVARHLVGVMNDPIFGKTIASTFGELVLAENELDFGDTSQYISVELHLPMDYHYGDKSDVTILVNKIEDDLSTRENYYTFDNAQIGENIGSFTITPENDLDNQLAFPLSNAFGISLFTQTEGGALKSQSDFRNYLKGISLQAQSGNSIVGFEYDSIFVRLNYISSGDTTFKDFSFEGDYHFNRVISDRTGTLLTSLTEDKDDINSTLLDNQAYIQASTRLNTRFGFSELTTFLEKKDVSVYKAELEVSISSDDNFDSPEGLFIYSSNDNNFELFNTLLAVNTNDNYVLLSDEKYTFDITDYMQRVITGLAELENFMLSVSPNGHRVDRLVIDEPINNIKIKIYYTEL